MGKKGFKILFFVLIGAALVGLVYYLWKVNSTGQVAGATSGTNNISPTVGKTKDDLINDRINGPVGGKAK